MTQKRTLVIGELNADLIVTGLPRLPALGEELVCGGFERRMGSSSAIFAVNLANLGVQVDFLGVVGNDDTGRFVVQTVENGSVGTQNIIWRDDIQTGVTISLSFAHERAMITYPGSIESLTLDDVDLDLLSGYDHLHVASYFLQRGLQPGLKDLFKRALAEGLTVSFDTGWDPQASWGEDLFEILQYTTVFLPNESEALALSGAADVETALRRLQRRVPCTVAKLGMKGAAALDAEGSLISAPAYQVSVADTTGAGDSFDAGFVYAFLFENYPLHDALRFANARGALAVTRIGGTVPSPSASEVDAFITEHGKL
jgi:sugar/nucleoside kinase (ribokinase family)